jgi:hypothetical protein
MTAQAINFKLGTKNWEIDLGLVDQGSYPANFNPISPINRTRGMNLVNPLELKVLTYAISSGNVKLDVNPGKYIFKFNIRTFSYSLEKL